MKKSFWLGVALAALSLAQAPARAQPPLPLERFFQRPAVLDAKLSPSGKRLAITTSRGTTRIGLVVVDLEAEPKGRRAALFSDADIVNFDWVGDERLVFNVLDLEAGSGEDQRYAPGLYAVNADGSDFRLLVRRRGLPFIRDGSSTRDTALEWNHLLLRVPLPQDGVRPDEIVVGEMSFSGQELLSITPMWLNVRNGRTRSMGLGDAPRNATSWLFDSKGQPRLAGVRSQGRSSLHWRGPGQDSWRQIVESELLREPFQPSVVDDSGTLYITHRSGAEGYAVLTRYDFEAGKPQTPALVSAPGFDFSGSLVLDRAGSRALGVRVETDAEQTVWFDPAMKRMQALADERLPGRINRLSCSRCGAEDMVLLVRSFADRDPGRLWIYEAASQRWQAVSRMLDDIDPQRMASVALERIKARDGRDLPVWLTLPAGVEPGKPAPAVVLVHGGPWVRGGHWRWQAMEQFLASRGYLVIAPEFRGSSGYGEAHYRAGWKQWGRAMQDDVADALLWARQQGLANPERACIAGASYGGYSTLMGLVRHPELYRCGIAWVAVTDPFLYLKGSWWVDDDISDQGRRHMLPELVGDAERDAAMLSAASPLVQARHIKAPLLLAFGEADLRVPLAHGERLRKALTEAGHPPEWVTYANEGHSWRQVSTQVDFARRVERFLGEHLNKP
ncbi:alpha/beta hydrolase family protein [Paucibacter sp. XJ19-41]|uniref:alpha/beta hydrolase family protein n=1 Tax=Paucibacter sp. XJ19-41 TaxID=2927824 RepID=UPI00234BB107|nr:prolyl oligopeptidase family serine peptidase [Paucibacter sp. XJ19-41]MDC6169748.1 prolyl oligopeptidase family serine peptidase [Paucibacter sp. XJ19-41]